MYYRDEWYPPAPIVGTFHPTPGWVPRGVPQEVPVLTCTCFTIFFYEGVPTHRRSGFPRRTLARARTRTRGHTHTHDAHAGTRTRASCTRTDTHGYAHTHARTRTHARVPAWAAWVRLPTLPFFVVASLPFFSPLLCPSLPSFSPFLLPFPSFLLSFLPSFLLLYSAVPSLLSAATLLPCCTLLYSARLSGTYTPGRDTLRVTRHDPRGFVPLSS